MKAARSLQTGAALAYILAAISLLNIEAVFFGGTATSFISFVLNFCMQLLFLFLVGVLPGPSWARACGYSACTIQIILFVAVLYHLPMQTAVGFYYGIRVIKVLWIAGSSWEMKRAAKIVGFLLALLLTIYMFIPTLPQNLVILQNVLVLTLTALWFVLIGRMLTSRTENLPKLLSFPTQ